MKIEEIKNLLDEIHRREKFLYKVKENPNEILICDGNTIYNTKYNVRTNCGSCISTCFDGIKKLYKEYAKG